MEDLKLDEESLNLQEVTRQVVTLNDPKLLQELRQIEPKVEDPLQSQGQEEEKSTFRITERDACSGEIAQTMTDPASSFQNVQNHFAKIQENFDSMR